MNTKPESAPASVTPTTRTERDSKLGVAISDAQRIIRDGSEVPSVVLAFQVMLDELVRLRTERDELAATVEKLPKDATGEPIVVGRRYYYNNGYGAIADDVFDYDDFICGTQEYWWPTREAAEAAREKTE